MNFLRGAAVLTLAGFAVKILGSVNRIWLSRFLGGEGIGLYQMAYPVYLLFAAVASAGVPIAVSILVAEQLTAGNGDELRDLFGRLTKLFLLFGAVVAFFVYLTAQGFLQWGIISDNRAYYGIVAVLPAVFLAFAVGGMRGYFQGFQQMLPTAVSQVTEQFVRVLAMCLLSYLLFPYGLEYAAAGAAGGAGVGALFAFLILLWFRMRQSDRCKFLWSSLLWLPDFTFDEFWQLTKRLICLALPISLANLVIPLTAALDMLSVPNCLLAAGIDNQTATTQFGYLAGMAQPLILLATIPTVSLSFSIVPGLAEYKKNWQVKCFSLIADAMKISLLFVIPAGFGMCVLGGPLATLLYATPAAGSVLQHCGPAVFLLGLLQITNAVLQGLGKVCWPLYSLVFGVVVKFVFLTFFAQNIIHCAWATNLQYTLSLVVNMLVLLRCAFVPRWAEWLKIVFAAAVMAAMVYQTYFFLEMKFGCFLAVVTVMVLAIMVYGWLLWLMRVVTCEEIRRLSVWRKK